MTEQHQCAYSGTEGVEKAIRPSRSKWCVQQNCSLSVSQLTVFLSPLRLINQITKPPFFFYYLFVLFYAFTGAEL